MKLISDIYARWVEITEMSHSILRAKRATYVYIFSGQFLKPEAYGQTVLPDRSILIGQKLVENAKIKYSNATFWVVFKQSVMVSFRRGNRQIEKLPKSC